VIPSSVEFIGTTCFRPSEVLQEVIFEPHSRLTQIEERAFAETQVTRIVGTGGRSVPEALKEDGLPRKEGRSGLEVLAENVP
jgi:hypothetical protein